MNPKPASPRPATTDPVRPDPVDFLIDDLLEWIGPEGRPYADAIETWRTSCPRLPVWEDAHARGYLIRSREAGGVVRVALSAAGERRLAHCRRTNSARLPVDAASLS